jgi:hypothetical protein
MNTLLRAKARIFRLAGNDGSTLEVPKFVSPAAKDARACRTGHTELSGELINRHCLLFLVDELLDARNNILLGAAPKTLLAPL